jgi:hypothetical protein
VSQRIKNQGDALGLLISITRQEVCKLGMITTSWLAAEGNIDYINSFIEVQ